jgi:O-antigen ligase
MSRLSVAKSFAQTQLVRTADWLIIVLTVSLPWSTTATGILVILWLAATIPITDWADVRRRLATPAGGLPVFLVVLGLAGMLWADVTLFERWKGFESFIRLLAIPLLFSQFHRSDLGEGVFAGYLFSCIALLVASMIVMMIPTLTADLMHDDRVLVRNAATQSGEFVTCIFGLLYMAIDAFERRRWAFLIGISAVVLGMLSNIFFITTGRTALVVMLVLLILLAIRRLSGRGMAVVFAGAIVIGIVTWNTSPNLRERIESIWTDLQNTDTRTSSSERVDFWKRSVDFISQAPIIGNGTGSIHSLFEKSAIGQTGAAGVAAANPHNQTFAVAIQLGVIGAGVLWAMWIAHVLLFRGNGLINWIGLVVVVQNIVGSLFNSHLFDFVQGWVYVVGVGVAGGITLRTRAMEKTSGAATGLR